MFSKTKTYYYYNQPTKFINKDIYGYHFIIINGANLTIEENYLYLITDSKSSSSKK